MVGRMRPPVLSHCCDKTGLRFPDGTRRCRRHLTPEQEELLEHLDRRAVAVGIHPERRDLPGWPYGPNVDVQARQDLLAWAEPRGLRLSRSGRCLQWPRGKRCRPCDHEPRWLDHVTCWNHARKPAVLLAQPYHLSGEDFTELRTLESEGFVVVIGSGWYGHGTKAVEVWRSDQYERCADSFGESSPA